VQITEKLEMLPFPILLCYGDSVQVYFSYEYFLYGKVNKVKFKKGQRSFFPNMFVYENQVQK